MMPPNLDQRFVKLRLNGKWVQRRVRSEEQLHNIIDRLSPKDVYFSVSTWLQPDRVTKKHFDNERLISNIMLGSMMVLDIDAKHFPNKSLEEAKIEMIKVHHYLNKLRLKNNKYIFTGGGYQIWVTEWEDKFIIKKEPESNKRYRYYEFKRKKFVNMILDQDLNIDYSISLDNHRVVRMPGTRHRNGELVKIADSPWELN